MVSIRVTLMRLRSSSGPWPLDVPHEPTLAELLRLRRESRTWRVSPLRCLRIETWVALVLVGVLGNLLGLPRAGWLTYGLLVQFFFLLGGSELLPTLGLRLPPRRYPHWLCESIGAGGPTPALRELLIAMPLAPGEFGASLYHELRREQRWVAAILGALPALGMYADAISVAATRGWSTGRLVLIAIGAAWIALNSILVTFLFLRSQAFTQLRLLVEPPPTAAHRAALVVRLPLVYVGRGLVLFYFLLTPIGTMAQSLLMAPRWMLMGGADLEAGGLLFVGLFWMGISWAIYTAARRARHETELVRLCERADEVVRREER